MLSHRPYPLQCNRTDWIVFEVYLKCIFEKKNLPLHMVLENIKTYPTVYFICPLQFKWQKFEKLIEYSDSDILLISRWDHKNGMHPFLFAFCMLKLKKKKKKQFPEIFRNYKLPVSCHTERVNISRKHFKRDTQCFGMPK